ncbi:siroheme decarboxylase subunit beta [Alkalimarinus alittae]|uniref:siroheme decarboxylase n=1 Tax=Alkalimarinus alittae TaxID=2961619 RepID=A0ABY6N5W2_9ALTE|nr:AsnC family transcriptional regulator [Alkalimarinus alittae]UZE97512.1 AsnC family transcriptional regulator [Alkalimarinus alittae]
MNNAHPERQCGHAFQPSELDRKLIVATQEGLPLTARPYLELAEQLNVTEADVIERMQCMQDAGVIRRIAVVPDHYKLGYTLNGMTVWDVPDEMISTLGQRLGSLDFVSHCYHRPRHLPDWPHNLFAMVHGRTQEEVDNHIEAIVALLGEHNRGHDVLFSKRILKKTGLRIRK